MNQQLQANGHFEDHGRQDDPQKPLDPQITDSARKMGPKIRPAQASKNESQPQRIMKEAMDLGLTIGICTNSAAKAAQMNVVVTTNGYTQNEGLNLADIIVTCLGDPQGEKGQLIKAGEEIDYTGALSLDQLIPHFSK